MSTINTTNTPWYIHAKYNSTCSKCNKQIDLGSKCFWNKFDDGKSYHYNCRLSETWIEVGSNFDDAKQFAIKQATKSVSLPSSENLIERMIKMENELSGLKNHLNELIKSLNKKAPLSDKKEYLSEKNSDPFSSFLETGSF